MDKACDTNGKPSPKRLLLARPDGKRGNGRSNMRWLDGVDRDSERIGEGKWRSQARKRDEYKNLRKTRTNAEHSKQ